MTEPTAYPVARRSDQVDVLHGVSVPDPYRWLEDLDSEETRAWIEAQNALTDRWLAGTSGREEIRERITALWDYEKYGLPTRRGGRTFLTRLSGLANQPVLYVLDDLDAEPRVLLDPNRMSGDGTIALTGRAVSRDGSLLAYGLSEGGSDWMEWRVRDVATGEDLDDHLCWVKFSGASFARDGSGFYYSRYDAPEEGQELKAANRHHKLFFHRIGSSQDEDRLVCARPDEPDWGFGGMVTEDGRYLVIHVWKGTARENGLFYVDLEDGDGAVVELFSGFDARYGFVGNVGSVFFLETDLDAARSRVVAVDLASPAPASWREVIPEDEDALVAVDHIGGRLVATYLHHAHSRVRIFAEDGTHERDVDLPGLGSVLGISGRPDDPEAFYQFTGFTTPGRVCRLDVATGEQSVFRESEVDFEPGDYVTEQVFYESADGTRVPMFLCRRSDVEPSADTRCYLTGYGGFDVSLTPMFSVTILVWMERGGILAVPNLRGGGEYGKAWHDAGRLARKQNVFDDFIAAAEWLIGTGRTSTARLAIGGGSNGGLLVGACMTQRPDLFGACLPAVGVMDMLRFHLWTIGWAWCSDYGSPDDPEMFEVLRAYSPLHNLKDGTSYPATLVTTGDHDDRVYPAHSFKFAAALQAAQAGPAPALIRIETRAGHGMGKPTDKIIEEAADRWAFLEAVLGP